MFMSAHSWVNLTYTPVEVEAQADGTLHTFTNELSEELAREGGVLVCIHCHETLSTSNHDRECLAQK